MTRRAVTSTRAETLGPAGRLELALDEAGGNVAAVAVICHPHPLQQGTMQNKVVTTLARTFANLGAVAIRFDFRGVGDSEGSHADGVGERDDAAAVVAYGRERWPGLPLYLGGFSFGGAVALAIAASVAPRGLVTVAPPVARLGPGFVPPDCPWLLVHGSADDVVPAGPVVEWAAALAAPPRIVQLAGVGHFFHGHLNALSAAVTDFFAADFGARV
jgi:alpha/beta superfamily hydrolase